MRSFYLATYKDAASRLSRSVPELEETRKELDVLGKLIIQALAKRKQYNYSPEAYDGNYRLDGVHPEIISEVYKPILDILCKQDAKLELSEAVRRADHEAMSLLQKRILKAYDVAVYKKLHKTEISNGAREEEVLKKAVESAKICGIDPKTGKRATEIIIEKTIELEKIIFERYIPDFANE